MQSALPPDKAAELFYTQSTIVHNCANIKIRIKINTKIKIKIIITVSDGGAVFVFS